jgi:glycolate oxidase iron-sulfur subunit
MAETSTRNILEGVPVPDEEQYRACSRCGLCLSICPTYRLTWRETDSPRARLTLLRKVLEGELDISPGFTDEMYRCLDCLACNAICPVGIQPGDLVLAARAMIHAARPQPWIKALIFDGYFPNPALMQISLLPVLLYQRLGIQRAVSSLGIMEHFSDQLHDLEQLLPPLPGRSLRSRLPEVTAPVGERKYRVGFFLGCFQNLVFADASAAAVRVLARNGCEVVTPKNLKCCGMPHLAYGEVETARLLARHNIDILEKLAADVIITDCATCGSTLKEYGAHLLAEDAEYSGRARALSAKVRDISEFLGEIQLRQPEHPQNMRITYHDPCHLRRGQNIWREPRQLLQLAGAELIELREADWCCGSAGTQAITHYDNSMQILARKMQNVAETGAATITTGCPGCQLQLGLGAQRLGLKIMVKHPVQILDQAYQ